MKHVDFPYFSTLETIGFPFVFTRSYQILQKNWIFQSCCQRDIALQKCSLFFFKIIYFMKSQTKLVDSNMEFHGFFQLRRDATGAWNVFNFLNLSYLPRTATAKINQNPKKHTFFISIYNNTSQENSGGNLRRPKRPPMHDPCTTPARPPVRLPLNSLFQGSNATPVE